MLLACKGRIFAASEVRKPHLPTKLMLRRPPTDVKPSGATTLPFSSRRRASWALSPFFGATEPLASTRWALLPRAQSASINSLSLSSKSAANISVFSFKAVFSCASKASRRSPERKLRMVLSSLSLIVSLNWLSDILRADR